MRWLRRVYARDCWYLVVRVAGPDEPGFVPFGTGRFRLRHDGIDYDPEPRIEENYGSDGGGGW